MAELLEDQLKGTGELRRGTRAIGTVGYTIELDAERGHAKVVRFDRKPAVNGGDLVHLTLQGGQVLCCLMFDHSRVGAIVGEGGRRSRMREGSKGSGQAA